MTCIPDHKLKELRPRSDHVEATIEALLHLAKRLREGEAPEDLGEEIVRLGRMAWRKI